MEILNQDDKTASSNQQQQQQPGSSNNGDSSQKLMDTINCPEPTARSNQMGTNESTENCCDGRVVRHIMVIGFHHKHGYQVDYCYPPLEPDGPVFSCPTQPIRLPSCWKTLPLLCLPDGSHNYDSDTIYFTMPDRGDTNSTQNTEAKSSGMSEGIKTIFGTACYRQIQADKLLNRTDDMTRIAVQKSVCILSTKPLFGLIRSKLEMITHAYFEELDFSKVRILKLTYENLNSLLSRDDSIKENATYLGLSARELISQFGCNVLVLFKAMLLEKKILFYKMPVRDLCSTIVSMCSLFTGLLEDGGLDYSTCDLQLSSDLLEALKLSAPTTPDIVCEPSDSSSTMRDDKVFFSPSKEEVVVIMSEKSDPSTTTAVVAAATASSTDKTGEYEMIDEPEQMGVEDEDADSLGLKTDSCISDDPHSVKLCRMKPDECGLPLRIFTRGSFCLPYLSISYLDLLSDTRVRSFVIGATNFLFKQRKEMYDVIVDMEENNIIMINDSALKKCLSLTTEDLRFMDYLSRHVKLAESSKPRDEFDLISHDITKWVGGDEWIRYHFRLYTLYLLKASKQPASWDLFNASFVQTWKQTTNNYKNWDSLGKSSVLDSLQNRHPFSSSTKGINFSDMKLKISYAVNSSEKGKLINQTLNGIGRWSIWGNIASAASAAGTSISSASANVVASMAEVDNSATQEARSEASDNIKQPSTTGQEGEKKD